MATNKQKTVRCEITGEDVSIHDAIPIDLVRESLLKVLLQRKPDLDKGGYVCLAALDEARIRYAEQIAISEVDELSALRKEVADSIAKQELLTKDVDKLFEQKATTGERIADKVASFGGSWMFIGIFVGVLLLWMAVNSAWVQAKPFDAFPFMLLNLVLSCLAAIQAPVIMMSQNRQETKDRLRGENDFKVNMKAELEIQHLNEKMDKLINDQWKHLMEIQQMQMEMLDEYIKKTH